MFGKPGRPREDALRRRWEIYLAAAPLIEKVGARGLTMRQAANAAHLSLGGVYHYFDSKRDLVLFGLNREALQAHCTEMHKFAVAQQSHPQAQLATALEATVDLVSFCRPSLLAAIELGVGQALETAEAATNATLDKLAEIARTVRSDVSDAEIDALARALSHTLLGAMLDRTGTREELRNELRWTVEMTLFVPPRVGGRARG